MGARNRAYQRLINENTKLFIVALYYKRSSMNTERLVFETLMRKQSKTILSAASVSELQNKFLQGKSAENSLNVVIENFKNAVSSVDSAAIVLYNLIEDLEFEEENVLGIQQEISIILQEIDNKARELGVEAESVIDNYNDIEDFLALDMDSSLYDDSVREGYDIKEKLGF